jgi:hypothetical protein
MEPSPDISDSTKKEKLPPPTPSPVFMPGQEDYGTEEDWMGTLNFRNSL